MDGNKILKLGIVVLLIIVMLVSFFPLGNKMSKVETYKTQIEYLDKKSGDALKLTALAAGTSTAVSILPDDIGTPLANELMDIASYFGIAIGAVMMEKYLLTLIGFAVFKILIPVACLIAIVSIFVRNHSLITLAKKLFLFGLMLAVIVPTSVKASQMIENVYGFTIEDVEADAASLTDTDSSANAQADNTDKTDKAENQSNPQSEKPTGVLESIKSWFSSFGNKTVEITTNIVKSAGTAISETAKRVINKTQKVLSGLMEKLAIMIVTSCLIPILVFVVFVFISKALLNVDFSQTIKLIEDKRKLAVSRAPMKRQD